MHRKFKLNITLDSDREVLLFRVQCLLEEIHELITAVNQEDEVEMLDAIIDLLVYTYGTAIALGFSYYVVDAAFEEVMRANMEKEFGVSKRGHGNDLIKPEGWRPPDLKAILEKWS